MKKKKWIVQFRRPLILVAAPGEPLEWVVPTTLIQPGRVKYWNGGSWTVKYNKAHGYLSEEAAERAAFRLVAKMPDLIGELEVVPWTPISKPKR
jgi:hypothetical protein